MSEFRQVILFTDKNGNARFREESIPLDQGDSVTRLSAKLPAGGIQFRQSEPGFRSAIHVSQHEQWVFILSGEMEIGLLDGSSRRFAAGEHFYSADTLPAGTVFDPQVHGHWSRQVGNQPLVTAFVRA